MLINTVICSTN